MPRRSIVPWVLLLSAGMVFAGCQKSATSPKGSTGAEGTNVSRSSPGQVTKPATSTATQKTNTANSAKTEETKASSVAEKESGQSKSEPAGTSTSTSTSTSSSSSSSPALSASPAPSSGAQSATAKQTFTATLSGTAEVPSVTTDGSGKASLHVQSDGKEVHYTLEVHGLKDVTMAHLHMAPAGENGPVVVWLYPTHPPEKLIKGVSNGTIAEGTIEESSLTGPLKGKPMSELIAKLNQGQLYVNVHTQQQPDGELRGQLQ